MAEKLTPEEKRKLVNEVNFWWHRIDLGDGVITPGFTKEKFHRLLSSAIPNNLERKTVLDIGAWDGYYSFECEKRGAKVIAIDNNQHRRGHEGFLTAKRILNSEVEFQKMDLFDMEKVQQAFDIVLFFGVLYHIRYPLKALEIIAAKTKELLILESHYIKTLTRKPIMRFYPGKELSNDSTCWWGPNIQCIEDMLKTVGFNKIEIYKKYLHRPLRARIMIKAFK